MKTHKLLILGGIALIGYYLYLKGKHKDIDATPVDDKITPPEKAEEPKTIVLKLSERKADRVKKNFYKSFRKEYDSSGNATISPSSVVIKEM